MKSQYIYFVRKIFKSENLELFMVGIFTVIFIYTVVLKIIHDSGNLNLYVYQADALLRGRLNIESSFKDAAYYMGKYYSVFPLFPAIILIPFVGIFGVSATRVVPISLLFTLSSIFVFRKILINIGMPNRNIVWMCVAFFLGSGYWYVLLSSSGVWFFAHIVAVNCLLLAIEEAQGKGRGFLVGIYLSEAFLSRQTTIFAFIFLIILLFKNSSIKDKVQRLRNVFWLVFILFVAVYICLLLNWLRFGSFFDFGYSYIELDGFLKKNVENFGLFNTKYLFFNFVYMFLQGFHLEIPSPTNPRDIWLDSFGTSIIFASPYILISLFADIKKITVKAGWISIIMILLVSLLYYNNGWFQVNCQRFSLDFLPISMWLVGLGLKENNFKIFKYFVIYSVFLNIISLVIVPIINGSL